MKEIFIIYVDSCTLFIFYIRIILLVEIDFISQRVDARIIEA